ncbi:MAG: SPFH domain-containing protein [Planctomycetota bacterium]|nr:SPFH domain-containing protein [Planctomycetota bacterium]
MSDASLIRELPLKPRPGLPVLLLEIPLMIAAGITGLAIAPVPLKIASLVLLLVALIWLGGLIAVAPNEARVIQLFGRYCGTVHQDGLWWVNPFTTKRKISVRIRNFDCDKLKVNDRLGNPIEIGAVVVWRVVDTAEAVFEVDSFEHYVEVQSEAALRNLATRYPYDTFSEDDHEHEVALRSHPQQIANELKIEVQERLAKAGVEVIEARISHLAYAPEIASAMLQRQQADAIIAARRKIVDGAVGMVEMAINALSSKNVLHLDEERKAAMVSNLLVVLCSDRATQPVVNTGSLYN